MQNSIFQDPKADTPVLIAPTEAKEVEKSPEVKAKQTVQRIDMRLVQLQRTMKNVVTDIQTEIEANPDGLTKEQVFAALGKDKAMALASASAELVAFANKYAPGTFSPPQKK